MPRAPRKYIPKVKGCYQCSQRRINCDRGEPQCSKCVGKGLTCSGIGPRYRFRDGLARRKEPPMRNVFRPSGHEAFAEYHPQPDSFDDRIEEEEEEEEEEDEEVVRPEVQDFDAYEQVGDDTSNQVVLATHHPSLAARDEAIQPSSPIASPDHITPWQRHLLNHFSEHIAPEMAVIDDHNNGWRNLVLPLACADELVMSAVMSVSAFHLAEKGINNQVVSASMHYSKAIRELRKRQDLQVYDVHERYRIILAIVVLLLAMIVNGSPDFPIMFRMLQSALDMVGGEDVLGFGSQMIAEFSAQQISKMRVYASPFISQDEGVYAIATQVQQSWVDQQLYESYPAHSHALGLISHLRSQAFQIYLQRASSADHSAVASTDLISTFKQMLESFPQGVPGEHVLVWPIFIAASESHSPDHQKFFAGFLERQFRRSGFVNVLKALEALRGIWARNGDENWTTMLPKQPVFVM